MSWKELAPGCVVKDAGSASEYETGDWRSRHPEWDQEKCIKCGACYLFCPDAAIHMNEEGYPIVDPFYCKGCGICARECWTNCIKMIDGGEMPERIVSKEEKEGN